MDMKFHIFNKTHRYQCHKSRTSLWGALLFICSSITLTKIAEGSKNGIVLDRGDFKSQISSTVSSFTFQCCVNFAFYAMKVHLP